MIIEVITGTFRQREQYGDVYLSFDHIVMNLTTKTLTFDREECPLPCEVEFSFVKVRKPVKRIDLLGVIKNQLLPLIQNREITLHKRRLSATVCGLMGHCEAYDKERPEYDELGKQRDDLVLRLMKSHADIKGGRLAPARAEMVRKMHRANLVCLGKLEEKHSHFVMVEKRYLAELRHAEKAKIEMRIATLKMKRRPIEVELDRLNQRVLNSKATREAAYSGALKKHVRVLEVMVDGINDELPLLLAQRKRIEAQLEPIETAIERLQEKITKLSMPLL